MALLVPAPPPAQATVLRVATPWRILISGITGLYWALPFTGFFPLATSITTVTEFFSGKPAEDGPRP